MKNVTVNSETLAVLAAFIKEKRKGLTQAEFAKQCKVSPRTVAAIETQKLSNKVISSKVLVRFARGLQISNDEIFGILGVTPPAIAEVEKVSTTNILPLLRSIAESELTLLNQTELIRLISFEQEKGRTPPPALIKEMILFERQE